jgi:hypothetical protein
MDKKKKIIIVIVIILAVILLSVGGYFIYKNLNRGDDTKEDGNSDTGTDTGTNVDNSSGSSGVSNIPANPFSNSADLKKFQQYVINVKGDKAVLGTGGDSGYGDDGKWGRKSALAYDKYGTDYQAYLKAPLIPPKPTTTTTPTASNAFVKGEDVYSVLTGDRRIFKYPDSNSGMGYFRIGTTANNCKDTRTGNNGINHCNFYPIGKFIEYSTGGFSKIALTTKYFEEGFFGGSWGRKEDGKDVYIYTSMIKKK